MSPPGTSLFPYDPDEAVLAIETSGSQGSVALLHGDRVFSESLDRSLSPSRQILDSVAAVMAASGKPLGTLTLIGYGSGPGAFVGLRLACAIAQGLGFAINRPLVPVGTLQALAFQAHLQGTEQADAVWVAVDLRMGEVALAIFDRRALHAPWPLPRCGPLLCSPDQACAMFDADSARSPLLAGDGWQCHPRLRAGRAAGFELIEAARLPDAEAVARLARQGGRAGRGVAADLAVPTYLRDKVALDTAEQEAARLRRREGAST